MPNGWQCTCPLARACCHHVGPDCTTQLPITRVKLKLPAWAAVINKTSWKSLSFSGLLSQLTLMYLLHTLSLGWVDGLCHMASSAGHGAARPVVSLSGLQVMEKAAGMPGDEARREKATLQFPFPSGLAG